MSEPPLALPDLLGARVEADAGAPALVVDGGATLTFGDWDRRSNALARGLQSRGVAKGDRVALLFDNARWTDYAVSYLGVLKAGAVAVPLGTRFSAPELAEIFGHCQPVGLVAPDDLAPAAGPVAMGWVLSPDQPEEPHSGEPFRVPVAPADLAEVLYTSGTTGRSKGVACSHANVVFHDPPPDTATTTDRRMTFVHAFPVGTNAGQEVLRFPLRRDGRTAVAMPVFDPDRLCALVAEHGVKHLQLVPAMAQLILSSGAFDRHDVSSVERVTLSSAPTPPAIFAGLVAAFPKATLWNTYALTEAGTARTLMVYDPARPGSVGRGVGGTQVRIVGEEGEDLPAGERGEVWLSRPGAPMRWYYRDPEATAAAFVGECVRTGDVGYLDSEGYLYLTDRSKDVIITGGLNVSSVEVEHALHEHPEVVDAAVVGIPHPVLGQDVAAAVVLRSPVDPRQLQSFVRERLGEHKVPHRVVTVDELPRNASGKVLKRQVREALGSAPSTDADGEAAPPATDVEQRLLSVWEEVLGRDHIGVSDDFFDLGGQSLAATQVVARIRDALAVELPVDALFDRPTVTELAQLVEELRHS